MSSQLPALELGGLLDALEAPAPSPAGGTAAAATAAMAASLVVMVGRGSPAWADSPTAVADAATLRAQLLALGADDVRAFAVLLSAYRAARLPGSDETRQEELARGLVHAAEVPLAIAEHAATVVELAARAAKEGNPPMRPDAAAARILAQAAVRVAALLVRVNLAAVPSGHPVEEAARLLEAARRVEERAANPRGGTTEANG